jgi:hypothetical protein
MKKFAIACFMSAFCFLILTPAARSNWEYGSYYDDGSRLTFAFRGGGAMPFASMKNNLGSIQISYWTDGSKIYNDGQACIDGGGTCSLMGQVDLEKLPAAKKYSSYSWAGGVSIGVTIDGAPNVRAEVDWLRISEADYNASPLFAGDIDMGGGNIVPNAVAAVRSTVSTDVISAMIYYDFFEGTKKPAGITIPYIGAGLGYASSMTLLSLTDDFGDLSSDLTMQYFGNCQAVGDLTMCDFYTSETQTNNFALSAAIGFSYGIEEGVFFDMGARASFIPKIRWALNNIADENGGGNKERDVFSASNIIFMNLYIGIRFEF